MLCENCHLQHDSEYKSGRFCCTKCSRSFLKNTTRQEVGKKISAALMGKQSNVLGKKLPPQNQEAKKKIYENTHNRWKFGPWEEIPASRRKDRILFEQNAQCDICRMPQEWCGRFLPFEMDHISGVKSDNSRSNLRMICPNCHRQTDTWGSRNASIDGKIKMAESFKNRKKSNETNN